MKRTSAHAVEGLGDGPHGEEPDVRRLADAIAFGPAGELVRV
ncbi:hypothetical protein [Solirubrobacter pauli]|nr:hypothetical protein [Solirubrobacter pauli]